MTRGDVTFQSTRRRLAIWYTTVTAVLLLVFASGFFLYVRSTLIERVDDTLNHMVEVVQRSLVIESTPSVPYQVNLEASFRSNKAASDAVDDDRIDLEWFSPTGDLVWSTFPEPLKLPIHLTNHGETIKFSPDRWLRQITERLEVQGEIIGYLRVSHPWFEVTKPTQELMIDLVFGTLATVVLVAVIGWFLSRLAMEPIHQSYQYLKQFTADASHELRNPIALIQTNVQVALADPQPIPPDQRQQLEVIERLTRRLGRLVDDLLFLTRQDSGMIQPQLQPCPLDALLMEVIEEQTAIAHSKSIQLKLDIDADVNSGANSHLQGDPLTLSGDYDQLVRLFTNLVSNGIQYTPQGGSVKVTLQSCQRHNSPYLQVQVHDSGCGIPEEALPHVFERFYRVDPARSKQAAPAAAKTSMGTGLGLAIAQAIVQNHQGQIRVESVPNQGTTFTVLLPS